MKNYTHISLEWRTICADRRTTENSLRRNNKANEHLDDS